MNRTHLFDNPCIIELEEYQYLDNSNFAKIYSDQFTDLLAIVDSKSNFFFRFQIEFIYSMINKFDKKLLEVNQPLIINRKFRPQNHNKFQ